MTVTEDLSRNPTKTVRCHQSLFQEFSMRLKFVAAVAMLSACFAAHADTIVETFSVSGTAVENDSGAYGIDSTAIADFNTSLGTLNSITIVLSGEATNIDGGINQLLNIVSGSAVRKCFSGAPALHPPTDCSRSPRMEAPLIRPSWACSRDRALRNLCSTSRVLRPLQRMASREL